MSEGRLASVRETDRHAALIAGLAAAAASGVTFVFLHFIHVVTTLGNPNKHTTISSFWFLAFVAMILGFVVGSVEGAVASRAARRAADRFASLQVLSKRIFTVTAPVNAVLAVVAVSAAFSGKDRAIATFASIAVAIVASGLGALVFAWSHAVDWPHVPEYLKSTPSGMPRQQQRAPEIVDVDAGRSEVVNEPRSRRKSSNVDDEVWQEIQDLISGR